MLVSNVLVPERLLLLTPQQEEMAQALCARVRERATRLRGSEWGDLELNERQCAVRDRLTELLRAEGYETERVTMGAAVSPRAVGDQDAAGAEINGLR